MSHIELAIGHFKQKLRTIQQDRFAPFVLAPEIDSYLDGLQQKYPKDGSDFIKFLSRLSVDAIREEFVRHIYPDGDRISFSEMRTQHQNLRSALEQAILKSNWESASHCHERIKETEPLIEQWVKSHPTAVTPELLENALSNLGYEN